MVYLCIGLYVLFRRWTAPKSLHFFVFCLVSFVLYTFKYTGQLDLLDSVIFWGEITALALQPALFLHFAVDFSGSDSEQERYRIRRRAVGALLYLPGAALIGLEVYAFQFWSASGILLHRLDQIFFGYLGLYYAIAACVFVFRYMHARSPLERQQLKWLTRGTLVAFAPYTLLNVVPLLFDLQVPSLLTRISAACLVILPLTFSWAIVRYRLMDVDLIFKRGVTYTTRDRIARWPVLRSGRRCRRTRPHPRPEPWRLGPDGRHHRHRPHLRSAQARYPIARGSRL